jgi:hypothetical protein
MSAMGRKQTLATVGIGRTRQSAGLPTSRVEAASRRSIIPLVDPTSRVSLKSGETGQATPLHAMRRAHR